MIEHTKKRYPNVEGIIFVEEDLWKYDVVKFKNDSLFINKKVTTVLPHVYLYGYSIHYTITCSEYCSFFILSKPTNKPMNYNEKSVE